MCVLRSKRLVTASCFKLRLLRLQGECWHRGVAGGVLQQLWHAPHPPPVLHTCAGNQLKHRPSLIPIRLCCVHQAGYGLDASTGDCDSKCPIGTFNAGPYGPTYTHEPAGPFLGLGGDSSYEGSGYRSSSRQLMIDDESTATLEYAQERDTRWEGWPRSGKLPCTPCSAVLADINSTTGLTGADSLDDCIW